MLNFSTLLLAIKNKLLPKSSQMHRLSVWVKIINLTKVIFLARRMVLKFNMK